MEAKEQIRSRLDIAEIVGESVALKPAGRGRFKGLCPFHGEKTPSFHVLADKGFYYCFGCHAKGDAISFIKETENVSFMEAVEILAREVGMPMPARDPRAQEKSDRRSELVKVMGQAVQYFRLQLRTGAAADSRAYLERRGLTEAQQERWEIGFAPDGWQGLWDHLRGKSVPELPSSAIRCPCRTACPSLTNSARLLP